MDSYSDSDHDLSDIDDVNRPSRKRLNLHLIHHMSLLSSLKLQVPSHLDALAARIQAEIQAIKNKQDTMLWELNAKTPMTANTTPNEDLQAPSSRTPMFASIQLDSVDILMEDVYVISSSPTGHQFVLLTYGYAP